MNEFIWNSFTLIDEAIQNLRQNPLDPNEIVVDGHVKEEDNGPLSLPT